jgi:PST family polysaccharide transporter
LLNQQTVEVPTKYILQVMQSIDQSEPIVRQGGKAAFGTLSDCGQHVRQSIISGTRWATVGQVSSQLVRFVLSLFLARLLSPTEFGLMAMALVVIGFIELFKDLGTVSALVKVKDLSPGLLNGVFFLNLFIGVIGAAGVCLVAPLMARLYHQPAVTPILRVLALTIVISSASLVKRALLTREMRFGRLAVIDLVAALVNGIVAVILAACGFAVWSLIIATLVGSMATTLLLWLSSSWRAGTSFQIVELKTIAHFSLNMTGSQIFGYFITQADKFIIGVFLGEVALGVYALAQRLVETCLAFITGPVARVLFPAFSSIQEDDRQIAVLYSRACGAIALVAFPLLTGLALLAEPFVTVVLGEKWRAAIPLMTILAVPTIVQSLAITVASIYLAKSKAHWWLRWQITAGLLTASSYLVGVRWGITGVAIAYAVVILLLAYPAFAVPFRLIRLRVTHFLGALLPYVIATLLMLGAMAGARFLLHTLHASSFVVLFASGLTGGLVYVVVIISSKAPALSDISEFFLLRRWKSGKLETSGVRLVSPVD